jgi:hypothetical protein
VRQVFCLAVEEVLVVKSVNKGTRGVRSGRGSGLLGPTFKSDTELTGVEKYERRVMMKPWKEEMLGQVKDGIPDAELERGSMISVRVQRVERIVC